MVGLYEEPLEGEVVYKASKIPGATPKPLVTNTPEGLLELQLQLKFMMANVGDAENEEIHGCSELYILSLFN